MKIEMSIKDIDANDDLMNHIKEKGATVKVINNKLVLDLDNGVCADIFDDKKFDIEVNIKAKDKTNKISLKDLKPGDHFFIDEKCEYEFIVLEQYEESTFVISANNTVKLMAFGESADWRVSKIRTYLVKKYLPIVVQQIPSYKILMLVTDLTTLDGSNINDRYNKYLDKVGLLTLDEYRKYSHLINDENTESYWLLTPYTLNVNSTLYGNILVYNEFKNTIDKIHYGYNCGVRPVMMFENDLKVYKSTKE